VLGYRLAVRRRSASALFRIEVVRPLDQQEAQSEPGATQALCLCDGLNRKPNPALCLVNLPLQDPCITAVKTVKSVEARLLQT